MKQTLRIWKRAGVVVLMTVAILATGCLQLDVGVEMQDDGGATVTERLRLSGALIELDRSLTRHLTREAAAERMKLMGKGMTLVRHADSRIGDGSIESVAVFSIPSIDDLRLPNPFVQSGRPAPMMRLDFRPIYSAPSQPRNVGNVSVQLVSGESKAPPVEGDPAAPTPAGGSVAPLELQGYRDLRPVFASLMEDFIVKVSLTVPNQPTGGGRPAGPQTIRLLSFTGADLDRQAVPFLENEEAMLALLQFKLSDSAILTHTAEFPRYSQVPVHRGGTPYGSTSFLVRPTRSLFQKFFAGRPKSQGGDR